MTDRIYLYDTTLRDGQQTTGVNFSVSDKMTLAKNLDEGSQLFVQTDVVDVMNEIANIIDSSKYFGEANNQLALIANPFKIATEREKYAIKNKIRIYRKMYFRNSIKV